MLSLSLDAKKRIDQMFVDGALFEVKRFNKLKVSSDNSSTRVIGIEEITKFLRNEQDLNETKERIFIKTRQYAKRQTTWARGQMHTWQKIHPNKLNLTLKKLK